jgi:DNA polymerase I
MDIVIKSQETREGAMFRILKEGRYFFAELKFKNYFYIKKSDYELYEEDFLKQFSRAVYKADVVGQFVRVYFENNFMRVKLKDFFEGKCITYENDIKANKRLLLDKVIPLNNEHIPYLFFDIETDDRLPIQKDDRGKVIPNGRILSFAAKDKNGVEFQFTLEKETDEAEKELLTHILETFSKYGIISGWNSDNFDMPYIKQRCETLGVGITILDYINHLDYMEIYKKYSKKTLKSYSLNKVSKHEKVGEKLDQQKGNGAIYKTWLGNKEHLEAYNMEDSNLILKINAKLMFIEVCMNIANVSGCHVQSTMNESDCMDFLLMREYKNQGIVMPSKPSKAEVEERKKKGKIGGGYTTCFKPGFYHAVHVWDFKSLYPSIIQTWNVSPETYVDSIHKEEEALDVDKDKYVVTPSDFENYYHPHRIYLSKEGVIPKCVRILVEERDKTKYIMGQFKKTDPDKYKQMYLQQYALKTCANSIYGILSFPNARYYSWELGDTVTTCARATIKHCYKLLEAWGCHVLGGDTDSTFVVLNDNKFEDIDAKFVEFLKEFTSKWYVKNNQLVFEHEKVFEPMLFVMKKNYAYKIDDDITIKGMECVKSDSNVLASRLQEEFVISALNNNLDLVAWEKNITELQARVFGYGMTVEELTMVKALTKMPKDYEGSITDKKTGKPKIKADGTIQAKTIPAHVKLAERMLGDGKDLFPGSKIPFIVIKQKPILALSPEEFAKGAGKFMTKSKRQGEFEYEFAGEYDSEYYWLRILKPLLKVLHTYMGKIPEWDWKLTDSQMHKMIKAIEYDEEEEEDE